MNNSNRFFYADALFAASNSAEGFKCYYDSVFERERLFHLYIIKGGPGTGKSSFMRDVGEYFEGLGRRVAYYKCSSDPDSLDGIITDFGVALIDGTAPHSAEPEIAGARDDIVDLGAFWDSSRLVDRYPEICELCYAKNEAYRRVYRYLSAAGSLLRLQRERAAGALRWDKMRASVLRILERIGEGEGFSLTPALIDSIGMKGRVRYSSYEDAADIVYEINDTRSSGAFFLMTLIEMSRKYGHKTYVSYDPITPEYPDAVLLFDARVAFVLGDEQGVEREYKCPVKRINMERFLDMDMPCMQKAYYKRMHTLSGELSALACSEFEVVSKYHFELEAIYRKSMDFAAKERFTLSFCERLRDTYCK